MMPAMSGYLIDASVFIAVEQGRELGPQPEGEARLSVATLTELLVGVRRAADDAHAGVARAHRRRA